MTIGGQAVLEGVMMRGTAAWAVAVRGRDGAVAVRSFPLTTRRTLRRLPVVRGIIALAESLSLGARALRLSADMAGEEPVPPGQWAIAVAGGLALAVGLFFVVPVALASLLGIGSPLLFWLVEGALRTALLLAYIAAVSRLRDLRRLFEYHGAEHKAIACHEAGMPLTPERARACPRLHPRCGTSFLLVVAIAAIFVFAPLGLPAWHWLVLSRVLGIPLVAGVAFEAIRWAARRPALIWPGLQLQRLTTREPDDDQLEVAIAALDAVLVADRLKRFSVVG